MSGTGGSGANLLVSAMSLGGQNVYAPLERNPNAYVPKIPSMLSGSANKQTQSDKDAHGDKMKIPPEKSVAERR